MQAFRNTSFYKITECAPQNNLGNTLTISNIARISMGLKSVVVRSLSRGINTTEIIYSFLRVDAIPFVLFL